MPKTRDNGFENLIALCPTCHTRFDGGQIDRPSMRQYKVNLSVVSSRYSDLERRVIEHFVDNPKEDSIFLPGGLQLLLGYLIKDDLLQVKYKLFPGIGGGSIFTNDQYFLTGAGKEFVGHLRGNEPVADIVAWAEDYFSDGRQIFYEGDDPEGFAATVNEEFGLDVTSDHSWGELVDEGEGDCFTSHGFVCPANLLGEIYYSGRWPMGS